jgi:hypothetical protein
MRRADERSAHDRAGHLHDARKKLADVLVNGKSLFIRGGEYSLCDSREESCGCDGCCKHETDKTDNTVCYKHKPERLLLVHPLRFCFTKLIRF